MKIPYLFVPEDSRNQLDNGIDFSCSLDIKAALKISFWIAVGVFLTASLGQLV